ncbi:MAG: hypothetical protein ABGZ53_27240 [Fuerstiella sp.]
MHSTSAALYPLLALFPDRGVENTQFMQGWGRQDMAARRSRSDMVSMFGLLVWGAGRKDGTSIREFAAEDETAVSRLLVSHGAGTADEWARTVTPAAERAVNVELAAGMVG